LNKTRSHQPQDWRGRVSCIKHIFLHAVSFLPCGVGFLLLLRKSHLSVYFVAKQIGEPGGDCRKWRRNSLQRLCWEELNRRRWNGWENLCFLWGECGLVLQLGCELGSVGVDSWSYTMMFNHVDIRMCKLCGKWYRILRFVCRPRGGALHGDFVGGQPILRPKGNTNRLRS